MAYLLSIVLQKVKFVEIGALFFGVFLYFSSAHLAHAQSKGPLVEPFFYPLRITNDFKINAKLTNHVWIRAQAVYINKAARPNDQGPALVNTMVKVLYSDHFLYLGFWAYDPFPSRIRAHIDDHDQVQGDDQVGVLLDPYNSNQLAYEFYANPKGIQYDETRQGHVGTDKNDNFNMIWYTDGAVNDSGYTVVMKIPFKSIHFPDKDIQNWSLNFVRKYPRNNHYEFSWSRISKGNGCILCQDGHMVGLEGIENSNPINIIPYMLGFQSSSLNDPNDPASGLNNHRVDGRIGGTITYSPTSTSSADITFNPDFSQVETDATKISVNKTFALQYDEQRPFFLKKLNLFQTGYDLFYSRTINRPWAAAKYTQTANNFSIGFLTAYDRNTPFIVPGLLNSSTIASNVDAYDNILRGKYNIGSQSYIGGLLTTRNETGGHNYVGSIDWNFFLGHHFYFSGNAAYADTKELSDTTLFNDLRQLGHSQYDAAFNGQQYGGSFLNAKFERQAKYYNFSFGYKSIAPTFQAQNGFITQADRRILKADQEVNYYLSKKWISRGNLSISGNWRYDFSNMFKERFVHLSWSNYFPGQTQLSLMYMLINDKRFRGEYFKKVNHGEITLSSKPVKFFFI